MFSINEIPTFHRAMQSLKSHDFVKIKDNIITLDWENFDFLQAGDKINFAVVSVDSHDCQFQLTFTIKENEKQQEQD